MFQWWTKKKEKFERRETKKNEYDDLKKLVSVIKSVEEQSKFQPKFVGISSRKSYFSWVRKEKKNMQS